LIRKWKVSLPEAALRTSSRRSFAKNIRFTITERIDTRRDSKAKKRYKNNAMIEKTGNFYLEMFYKIEEAALKEKTTTTEIIRKTVNDAMRNKSIKFPYKQPLHKQEIHRGYTQKRKVISFTPEQVSFLEDTASRNNLYVSEVIRICVQSFFE
jgi:hypothetical protein